MMTCELCLRKLLSAFIEIIGGVALCENCRKGN